MENPPDFSSLRTFLVGKRRLKVHTYHLQTSQLSSHSTFAAAVDCFHPHATDEVPVDQYVDGSDEYLHSFLGGFYTQSIANSRLAPFLETQIYTLVVGPSQRTLTAHSGILAACSSYFQRMFLGSWRENHTCRVDWSVWSEDAAVAWLEWAYTGSYSGPLLADEQALQRAKLQCTVEPQDKERWETYLRLRDSYIAAMEFHAEVYVLAQYTAVDELMGLAVLALQTLVEAFLAVDDEDLQDWLWVLAVGELAGFVYDNTAAPNDLMREVLCRFLAERCTFPKTADDDMWNVVLGYQGEKKELVGDIKMWGLTELPPEPAPEPVAPAQGRVLRARRARTIVTPRKRRARRARG
ncbi:hypothetical protein FN846DRAFT_919673 [Sphaerosporella brunnea]|uniref:BTB domain-containing protein n=1 Tax=Sphaerosporella brunnea TaxID=1250544 RepID=A0A5J5EVF0_9PEZI|nr:hypothetical protein FN846DRAFT_919673 [Sphaerosporella brunnea]